MPFRKGMLEILERARGGEPKSFKDFTYIRIHGKPLSSATISKRLIELIAKKLIEEAITKSNTGRRIIAYRTTEKGELVVIQIKELKTSLGYLSLI
jgi:DNA-binding PadR family transcriptional regulator